MSLSCSLSLFACMHKLYALHSFNSLWLACTQSELKWKHSSKGRQTNAVFLPPHLFSSIFISSLNSFIFGSWYRVIIPAPSVPGTNPSQQPWQGACVCLWHHMVFAVLFGRMTPVPALLLCDLQIDTLVLFSFCRCWREILNIFILLLVKEFWDCNHSDGN